MACCTCFLPQLGFAVWFTDQKDDCWEKNMDFKRIAMIIWLPAYALFVRFAKRAEKCNKEDLLLIKQWDINPFTSTSGMSRAEVMRQWLIFALVIHLLLERWIQEWLICDFMLAIHYLTLTFIMLAEILGLYYCTFLSCLIDFMFNFLSLSYCSCPYCTNRSSTRLVHSVPVFSTKQARIMHSIQ